MNKLSYFFLWQGDMYVGVPLPNENSELTVYASDEFEVDIGETIIESGQAIVPVRFRNKTYKDEKYEIKFEFEG